MKKKHFVYDSEVSASSSTDTLLGNNNHVDYGSTDSTRCPSIVSEYAIVEEISPEPSDSNTPSLLSTLKSRALLFTIINFALLVFSEMCYSALMPLMYSTPIELGGLGLSTYAIGVIMGIWGFVNIFIQINVLGKVIRKYGATRVYRLSYAAFFIIFWTFPLSAYLARVYGGIGVGVYFSIAVQLGFQFFVPMCFGKFSSNYIWKLVIDKFFGFKGLFML